MTKTQIDRLGNRLRESAPIESDLRLLDEYRRSFGPAYESVVGKIRQALSLETTGRPAKSTISIVEKLRRESIRLTQIQDIAGCRLIVSDGCEQERVVDSLRKLLNGVVVDRRDRPSHGYRAVHLIANCDGKLIEIQVRTRLQHLWGGLSEKFSDVVDKDIKYGGGDEEIRSVLTTASKVIAHVESNEKRLAVILADFASENELPEQIRQTIDNLQRDLAASKHRIADLLENEVAALSNKEIFNDLFD